jgi:hypothetical protein
VNLEISPQPSEAERAAIVAALAAEEAERAALSPWADEALPQREAENGDEA